MNTLLIVGLIAIGLGLLVMIGALFAILRAPQTPTAAPTASPRSEPRASAPKVREAPPEPAPAPAAEPPAPPLVPTDLPEEDENDEHLNTGVLNAKDFDNLEDLMAAADKLTRKRSD